MEKSIYLLLILFSFAVSFAQQEPTVKFYMNDGSQPKEYKISEIENIGIITSDENYILKLFYQDSLELFYSTKSIDSMKFEYDTNNVRYFNIYVFGEPKSYLFSDIDSINFSILETKISKDVVVIDSSEKNITTIDSSNIIFNDNSTVGNTLKVGDIITSEPTELAPNGYLKRIKSIKIVGNSIIVETENVNLTDVIENGIISIQKSLTPADTGKGFMRLDKNDKIQSNEPFTKNFDKVLFDLDGNEQTTNDQINISGILTVNPELNFNIVIENRTVKQMLLQLSANNDLELNASAKLEYKKDIQKSLNEMLDIPPFEFKPIVIMIGWFPVVITSNIDFQVGCNIDLGAEVSTSIAFKTTTSVGLEYNSGVWKPIKSFTNNFTFNPPSLSVGGSMKVFLGPQMNVSLYGKQDALNSYVNVFGFAELEVDLVNKPLWKLFGGVEGNAGVESEWFDFHKNIPLLLDYRIQLAQANDLISSVNPTEGKAGEVITIKGNAFGDVRGTNYVGFKDGISLKDIIKATEYTKWTDTEIQVKVPSGLTAGNSKLILNVGGYLSNTADFKIIQMLPSITSITPNKATRGESIIILGDNFGDTRGINFITINGVLAEFDDYIIWSNKSISLKVPSKANTGVVSVTVKGEKSNEVDFIVLPQINTISPNWFKAGDEITITGSNFGNNMTSSWVEFNDLKPQPSDYVSWTETEIKIKAPVGVIQGKIYVITSDNKSNGVDYNIIPQISSITPISASIGDEITITGSGFGDTQGSSFVSIGNINVNIVSIWSDDQIKLIIPDGVTGFKISVTVDGHKSNEIDFAVVAHIAEITPTYGKIGDEITITGTGFGSSQGTSFVSFGSTNTSEITIWGITQIKVNVPSGAESGKLSVTVNSQKSNEIDFTIVPNITGISPNPEIIGNQVTITGNGFGSTQGTSVVKFNGTATGTAANWSASQILINVPTGATSGNVTVTVDNIESTGIDFAVKPNISSINPTSGQVGTSVTIAGTGFGATRGTSIVKFNGTQVASSDYTSWSATQIVAKVPTGATSGNVTVTCGANESNGSNFTISTSNPDEVTIGTQVWMTKNLDVSTYRNGDAIPQVTDQSQWANLTTGAWCYYDNDPANGEIYGKLYNWYAVNDSRGLAPSGWHVPSDAEWTTLTNYLGGLSFAGGKMKEAGTTHWLSPNYGATNESGFSAFPGGYRANNGYYNQALQYGEWWSSTEKDATQSWYRTLSYAGSNISRAYPYKVYGLSVRCIKD